MRSNCESGAIIRAIRRDRNLPQQRMAELAKCSLRNYQKIEAGETQPGYAILKNIVDNLNIDPRELFGTQAEERAEEQQIRYLLSQCNGQQQLFILSVIQKLLEYKGRL